MGSILGTARVLGGRRRRVGWLAVTLISGWLAGGAAGHAASGTRVVPRLTGGLTAVYDRLYAAGLRVSIAHGATFDVTAPPRVARSAPRPGTKVARGTAVTLYLGSAGGSSRRAGGRLLSVIVPSFAGRPVRNAYAWATSGRLHLRVDLGPLQGSSAPTLLSAYQVTAQHPLPGRARLRSLVVSGRQPPPRLAAAPLPVPIVPAPAPTTPTTSSSGPPAPTTSTTSGSGPPAPAGDNTGTSTTPPSGPTSPSGPTYYQNPVFANWAFPDPFVLDNGGTHSDYWAFSTGDRFPMLHSTDLVHWSNQGTALTAAPTWVSGGDWHPWAPSVIQSQLPCPGSTSAGCYVMFYVGLNATYNRNCIGVATSAAPGGPYADQGPLPLSGQPSSASTMPIGCGDANGVGNIDPSPFLDPSGQAYLYLSTDNTCTNGTSCTWHPTISVIPLTSGLLSAASARVPLFSGSANTWEAANVGQPTVEGPFMELHDGTYYLFYSGGSWQAAYGMGYATATKPEGPFTKSSSNPILAETSTVFSPGGGDRLVTGPHGGSWLLYHARAGSYSQPRTLRLDPFRWQPASTSGLADLPVIDGPSSSAQSTQP